MLYNANMPAATAAIAPRAPDATLTPAPVDAWVDELVRLADAVAVEVVERDTGPLVVNAAELEAVDDEDAWVWVEAELLWEVLLPTTMVLPEFDPVTLEVAVDAELSWDVEVITTVTGALLSEADELKEVPLDDPDEAQLGFALTENWVESKKGQSLFIPFEMIKYLHWNSPVPSTMISMPYPVSVDCTPELNEHGTLQL